MARIYNLPCLVIIAVFTIVTAQDYCNVQYSSQEPASACGQPNRLGLTDDERAAIVRAHNQIRRKVASGQESRGNPGPQYAAVTMPDLVWDWELEAGAQGWANQCDYKHDKCRKDKRFYVGQNLIETLFSGRNPVNLESLVHVWCDNEVVKFSKNDIFSYKLDNKTAHYTQLVWADTTKVGCGYIEYKQIDELNTQYLVCNYGPGGNIGGAKVYTAKY